MSHEIEEVTMLDGRKATEAMFADGRPAWHGLGYTWEPGVVPSSAMVREKMPSAFFRVEKEEIALVNQREGVSPIIKDQYALVRQDTGTPLHVVGKDYKVWQNEEAFEFLDSLQMDGIIKYETVVVMKGGKNIALLARLPGADTIAKGDHSFRYVLCSFSHGGGAIVLTPTAIRVVCWNTQQLALGKSNHKVSLRHSGDLKSKLDMAHHYISQFDSEFTRHNEDVQKLLVGCTQKQRLEYVNELFPISESTSKRGKKASDTRRNKKLDEIRAIYTQEVKKLPHLEGTWHLMFQAVTGSVDHGKRQQRGKNVRDSLENRFMSVTGMTGNDADFKNQALELALQMAS